MSNKQTKKKPGKSGRFWCFIDLFFKKPAQLKLPP